jgi:hypothetical protein
MWYRCSSYENELILIYFHYFHPPVQWVPEALSPGVKRPGPEADQTSQTSAKHKENFTFTYFPYFEKKMKVGLCGLHAVCVSVYPPLSILECLNQSLWNYIYIMAPEPILRAYFINPYRQFVWLYVYPTIVARQRLGKNVTAATNVSRKIFDYFLPER